jgi:hypothetical protein
MTKEQKIISPEAVDVTDSEMIWEILGRVFVFYQRLDGSTLYPSGFLVSKYIPPNKIFLPSRPPLFIVSLPDEPSPVLSPETFVKPVLIFRGTGYYQTDGHYEIFYNGKLLETMVVVSADRNSSRYSDVVIYDMQTQRTIKYWRDLSRYGNNVYPQPDCAIVLAGFNVYCPKSNSYLGAINVVNLDNPKS